MKILITGILGFIGSNLAERLVRDGDEVCGLIRRVASRKMDIIAKISEDITLISGDITDNMSTRNAIKTANPDTVIHLAALSPVRDSFERPFEYQQANLVGTMNVAHAILELPDPSTRRVIVASTAEVYGLQREAQLEETLPLKPSSPYAVSKAAADLYVPMMFNSCDLHGTIMRPANSYGRKFDNSFIVEYLVTQMLKGENVYVGAPESVRDYMYVDDHVSAYVLSMDSKKADRQVYNVGTSNGISNKELAFIIAKKTGFDTKNITVGSYPPGYPYRPQISDQPSIVLDSRKIRKELNWEPKVSLDEGLDRIISYYRDLLKKPK